MPKGPQGQKRPADTVASAIRVAKILTGKVQEDAGEVAKDPAARALGTKGGKARAAKMTPEERAETARHAARARWQRSRNNP